MNMMKILLAGVAAMLFSLPALAANHKNCADAKDIGKCLDQQSSPAAVRQAKIDEQRALCDQNAKNQGLQGNARSSYLSSCMNEDEAAKAAKASAAGKPMPAEKKRVASHKTRPHKAAAPDRRSIRRSCIRQANKEHLKGKKRNQFLHNCYKG